MTKERLQWMKDHQNPLMVRKREGGMFLQTSLQLGMRNEIPVVPCKFRIEMSANVDELFQKHSIDELNEMLACYELEEAEALAEIKR